MTKTSNTSLISSAIFSCNGHVLSRCYDVVSPLAQGGMLPRNAGVTTMATSLIAALALASVAATGFAGQAQAHRWDCAMPITKGGCSVLILKPEPQLPRP
jgi:hypothetical protein